MGVVQRAMNTAISLMGFGEDDIKSSLFSSKSKETIPPNS